MAAFLRKKATLPKKPSFLPPTRSDDAPPTLPPLLLSSSLHDPDPPAALTALPPAASPPVLPSSDLVQGDVWDPWNAFADVVPRLDSTPSSQRPSTAPSAPPVLSASNASRIVPNTCSTSVSHPSSVATAPTSRKTSTRQLHTPDPKTDPPSNRPIPQKPSPPRRPSSPPAVVRGHPMPPSTFDFEESLSAANVTSVVNQFRSYHPPIRHLTSPAPSQLPQMAAPHAPSESSAPHRLPQKPGSSSSLSSSSHNTDSTRRTNGSYSTSTSLSSISPVNEVIDAKHPVERLDPDGSPHINSLPALANASSQAVPARPRGSSVDYNLSSVASRTFTTSNVNSRAHRPPTAPPTSYSERVRTLARQPSLSTLASSSGQVDTHTQPPMLYDMLRSGNPDSVGPLRRGPLIFSATAAPPPAAKGPLASPSTRAMNVQNAYPSPPAEYAPLEASAPPRRNGPTSSASRGSAHFDLRLRGTSAVSPTSYSSDLPPLSRKTSKGGLGAEHPPTIGLRVEPGSEYARRVLTKARPTTPQKPVAPSSQKVIPEPGDPLLLDDDPFAKTEGVRMLRPHARLSSSTSSTSLRLGEEYGFYSEDGHVKSPSTPPPPVPGAPVTPDAHMSSAPEKSLPTPTTPDDYKVARQQRRGLWLEKVPPPAVAEVAKQLSMEQEGEEVEEPPREPTPPPTYFPIVTFMSDANLFPLLLSYLSYSEWLALYSANKQVRELFQSRILREFVLERYLGTVGYSKWNYEWAEPLELSLKDLHNYLRGVAMPAHQYARLAVSYLQPKAANRGTPTSETPDILALALTTRAYTRVVLRLRAQAESEAKYLKTLRSAESNPVSNPPRPGTHQPSVSSRAPSPTSSHSDSRNHSHGKNERNPSFSSAVSKFKSPLYRPERAPVLRVFVPSPEGDWLSDAGVVECEAELKRSGILKLLRVGDIVWDVAVGDEGNLGRLMWDGSYLVDLDYRYSRVGELSPYFHSLAFSPSYFHRVIRIGGSATHNPHCNPLIYIDVSPWGREIAANLQLLQDRARTETPHGALHDVVRWVHRSAFTIRPPVPPTQSQTHTRSRAVRVPIPNVDGFYIDPGWYGKVVLESEGTHEGLVDLQTRCGPGVFPPRAESLATKIRNEKEKDNRRVWRILREKSRPGEIWLRAVQVKERIM